MMSRIPRRRFCLRAAGGLTTLWLAPRLPAQEDDPPPIPDPVTARPRETDELLVNPGIGFETFHTFNGEDDPPNYPRCSIAYFRFYWDRLEPREGQYAFEMIDGLLARAARAEQQLALRFMPMDTEPKAPKWFMSQAKGHVFEAGGQRSWAPDFNDPYFLEKQEQLVRAFAERYNGHPGIARLDIGSVGRWGEWHTAHLPVPMPTEENALRVIDWYLNHWSRTPLSMLINHIPGLRHAVRRGAGWRADSLGDYGHFDPDWNHMRDMYPHHLAEAGALDAWKRGPVTFEPPGTMNDLVRYVPQRPGGYDAMWDRALQWGGSSFNAKSNPIPDRQVPSIQRFLKRCGYRLVVRSFTHARSARPGGPLPVRLTVENIGVAPPYRAYIPALRLRRQGLSIVHEIIADPSFWLPGRHELHTIIPLPTDLPPGTYRLALALLDPHDRRPAVRLPIEGRESDNWHPLSTAHIG